MGRIAKPPARWEHFTIVGVQYEDGYYVVSLDLGEWGVWQTGVNSDTEPRLGDTLSLYWHGAPGWTIHRKVLGEKTVYDDGYAG